MSESLRPAELARRARMDRPTRQIVVKDTRSEHLSDLFSTVLSEATEEANVRRRLQRMGRTAQG